MKLLREENGQTLVLTAICMTVMLGFMALALDVGTLFRAKRKMQIAADAAAMAGTTEFYYNGTKNVAAKAYAAAKANGVDNTVSGNTVNVILPPVSVGGTSCATCVEVRLITPNPTFFMGLITHSNSVNVGARAIAGAPSASHTCVYVMNPDADKALWIHGAGAINAPDCDIYVNSDANDAVCITGSAQKSDFGSIDAVGGQGSANCGGSPGGTVSLKSSAQVDPWLNLPDPSKSCDSTNTITLTSGTLTGTSIPSPGYGKTACYAYYATTGTGKNQTTGPAAVTINNATLGPGTYVFTTGVYITGSDVIGKGDPKTGTYSGGGATIAVSGTSSLNIDTNSSFSIYAPADPNAVYNGVALYQSPSDTSPMLISFGSSSATFDGMIYAPGAAVTLHDEGGGGLTATGMVVGTLYVNGQVNLSSYNTFNPVTTPFKVITLVE